MNILSYINIQRSG